MKIKLRDMTLEQYEKWVNKNCNKNYCDYCMFNFVRCLKGKGCWVNHKDLYSDKFLDQEFEVEEEHILTEEEHKYLLGFIGSLEKVAIDITKSKPKKFPLMEEITIEFEDGSKYITPRFAKDKYFKKLELNLGYDPEDLGL